MSCVIKFLQVLLLMQVWWREQQWLENVGITLCGKCIRIDLITGRLCQVAEQSVLQCRVWEPAALMHQSQSSCQLYDALMAGCRPLELLIGSTLQLLMKLKNGLRYWFVVAYHLIVSILLLLRTLLVILKKFLPHILRVRLGSVMLELCYILRDSDNACLKQWVFSPAVKWLRLIWCFSKQVWLSFCIVLVGTCCDLRTLVSSFNSWYSQFVDWFAVLLQLLSQCVFGRHSYNFSAQ